MRYILIDQSTNEIVNAIEIDPDNNTWPIPEGRFIVQSDIHEIGKVYVAPYKTQGE